MSDRGAIEMLFLLGSFSEDERAKIDEYLEAGGDPRGVFLGMSAVLKNQRRMTELRLYAEAKSKESKGYKRKITIDKYIDAHTTYNGYKQAMFELGLDVAPQALHKFEQKHPHAWLLLPGAREKIKEYLKQSLPEMIEALSDASKEKRPTKKVAKKKRSRTK